MAHEAVRTGGSIALFWNKYIVADKELRNQLADIDARYGVDYAANGVTIEESEGEIELEEGWPAYDLASDSRFEDLVSRRYRRDLEFADEKYIDLLASRSAYRLMGSINRERLFDNVRTAIAGYDDSLSLHVVTDLFLARTAPVD